MLIAHPDKPGVRADVKRLFFQIIMFQVHWYDTLKRVLGDCACIPAYGGAPAGVN
jgi:hypothetical protein